MQAVYAPHHSAPMRCPFHPYRATIMKQKKGTQKDVAVDRWSEIHPINDGTNAPPTIDMMSMDDAFFFCTLIFFMPIANMVGNMMLSKKKMDMRAYTEKSDHDKMTNTHSTMFMTEYDVSKIPGDTLRIRAVPIKRPIVKSIRLKDSRLAAFLLSISLPVSVQ